MAYIITLDIGGTNIRAAISDEQGYLLNTIKERTIRHDHEAFIAQVVAIVGKLKFPEFNPIGISLGVPGRVRKNGFIDALPNVGLNAIDLLNPLKNNYNLPVSIKNDAEMAAFAEAKLGVGRNAKSTYFVTISTGIGGCLVADGKLKNPSVEIGHTLINYRGSFYELEKIASGDGILTLCRLNGLNYKSGSDFFTAVGKKDRGALVVFNEWLTIISDFFAYINESFSPEVIAVTGGVLKAKALFFDDLKNRVPAMNLHIAYFDEDAGLVGAAAYGFSLWQK